MSKGELNDLELEINRYLDGDISDDEFERFLADRSEGIDIERLLFLGLPAWLGRLGLVYQHDGDTIIHAVAPTASLADELLLL